MLRAVDLAVENVRSGRGGPFGAVIARQGSVLCEGVNLVTSGNDPTAHAEVVAIREACRLLGRYHLSGYEIYASCEPCPMCLGAIYWARLDRVYFCGTRADAAASGFSDAAIYREIESAFPDRKIPVARLLPEEAGRPFEAWATAEGRVEY